jgi:Ca2+:H+ antiporter
VVPTIRENRARLRFPRATLLRWTNLVPLLGAVALVATLGRKPGTVVLVIVALLLAGSVLAAVHHAEVVAHYVGEPLGSVILAVAVTVIEVGLIVTLMSSGGDDAATLGRDTVFAAVMITANGIVGLSLLVGVLRQHVVAFGAAGISAAQSTVATLATLTLVLPAFTTSTPGPRFSTAQLVFASIASIALYALFVFVQTVRHRDYFVPEDADHDGFADEEHAPPPTPGVALLSLAVLVVALADVVGLAKVESKPIEDAVASVGAPQSAVGVVIALLVLMPETLAAVRNAARGRVQISLNLAYGSAMASIGLTIPALAVASIWLAPPLELGLGPTELVLLAITFVTGALTAPLGQATVQQSGVRLVLFAAFLVLAVFP